MKRGIFMGMGVLGIVLLLAGGLAWTAPRQPQQAPASASNGAQGRPAVPSNTGSSVPQAQAQAALDFHNAARQKVGVAPLQWSTDLAAVAQVWANHLANDRGCMLEHGQPTPSTPYGQNLCGGKGEPSTALSAAQAWYSEIDKFHYGVLTDANWYPTGHYTEMIWHATTQVGMAQATCSGGGTVVVAEYNPPGNIMGQKPY